MGSPPDFKKNVLKTPNFVKNLRILFNFWGIQNIKYCIGPLSRCVIGRKDGTSYTYPPYTVHFSEWPCEMPSWCGERNRERIRSLGVGVFRVRAGPSKLLI